MIGRLTGHIADKSPPQITIDVNGVGYEVEVPMSTFCNLPAVGPGVAPVTLLTHQVVREDAHLLFGFLTAEERSTFRLLVKISGIGPRTALAVLSGMSVQDLAGAIARQEAGRLQKVPGIGKKTAERLLLELKDKLTGTLAPTPGAAVGDAQGDIVQALLALGYNEKEAALAMKTLPAGASVSDGIKHALKALS